MNPLVAKYGEKLLAFAAAMFIAAILLALGKLSVDALRVLMDITN